MNGDATQRLEESAIFHKVRDTRFASALWSIVSCFFKETLRQLAELIRPETTGSLDASLSNHLSVCPAYDSFSNRREVQFITSILHRL